MTAATFEAGLVKLMTSGVPAPMAKSFAVDGWQALGPNRSVLSATSPIPQIANAGDSYLTPSGSFVNNIAIFGSDGVWHYTVPWEGDIVYVQDALVWFSYIAGAWMPISLHADGITGIKSWSQLETLSSNAFRLTPYIRLISFYDGLGKGGGLFAWDESSGTELIAAIDGYTYRPSDIADGSPGILRRILDNDTVNPFMLGCKGDGSTDDSVAWQNFWLFDGLGYTMDMGDGKYMVCQATPANPNDSALKTFRSFRRQPCRVATPANITLSAPGMSIDGVVMNSGDLVLVQNQTDATENGPKYFTAYNTPMIPKPTQVTTVATAGTNINISNPGTATFGGVTVTNRQNVFLGLQTTTAENGVYRFNGTAVPMTLTIALPAGAEIAIGNNYNITEGNTYAGLVIASLTPNSSAAPGTTSVVYGVLGTPTSNRQPGQYQIQTIIGAGNPTRRPLTSGDASNTSSRLINLGNDPTVVTYFNYNASTVWDGGADTNGLPIVTSSGTPVAGDILTASTMTVSITSGSIANSETFSDTTTGVLYGTVVSGGGTSILTVKLAVIPLLWAGVTFSGGAIAQITVLPNTATVLTVVNATNYRIGYLTLNITDGTAYNTTSGASGTISTGVSRTLYQTAHSLFYQVSALGSADIGLRNFTDINRLSDGFSLGDLGGQNRGTCRKVNIIALNGAPSPINNRSNFTASVSWIDCSVIGGTVDFFQIEFEGGRWNDDYPGNISVSGLDVTGRGFTLFYNGVNETTVKPDVNLSGVNCNVDVFNVKSANVFMTGCNINTSSPWSNPAYGVHQFTGCSFFMNADFSGSTTFFTWSTNSPIFGLKATGCIFDGSTQIPASALQVWFDDPGKALGERYGVEFDECQFRMPNVRRYNYGEGFAQFTDCGDGYLGLAQSNSSSIVANVTPTHNLDNLLRMRGDYQINPFNLQTTGSTHTNTTLDTLASTTGLLANMIVVGAGIPANTTIVSVDSTTQVTLSAAATASASIAVTFMDPAKLYAPRNISGAGNPIYYSEDSPAWPMGRTVSWNTVAADIGAPQGSGTRMFFTRLTTWQQNARTNLLDSSNLPACGYFVKGHKMEYMNPSAGAGGPGFMFALVTGNGARGAVGSAIAQLVAVA